MYRISRVYIANAGHKLAWYPGLLLPFTDTETGLPTQAIYNLANQGGKTTFLSLVFSVFDTHKDRFLQTMANPAHDFVDYFDKEGLPGIIMVEWDMPSGDMVSPRKRFVTGQFVCLRKSGDGPGGLAPERHFFSFVANDRLSLESVPGPNLKGAKAGELHGREDCGRWLYETAQAHRGNFQYFTNQTEWKEVLLSNGLDVELLQKQVDFNRKEGGMDEAFLDFKSELDFVRRFLLLTLDPDRASETQKLVASLCRKMASRKRFQDALAQMQRLGSAFEPFAKAAQEYQAAILARDAAEQELGIAAATLSVHIAQKSEQADAQDSLQREKDAEHREQTKLVSAADADAEALETERLSRASRRAQNTANAAEAELKEAQRGRELLGASKLNDEILRLQSDVTGLEQALREANQGTAPLRQTLGEKSAIYRRMLADLAKGARAEAVQFKESAAKARQEEKRQESAMRAAQQAKQAALDKQTEANTLLARAADRRSALIKDGVLGDNEQAVGAIARVSAEMTALSAEIAKHEQAATTREAEEGTLSEGALTLDKQTQPMREEQQRLEKAVKDGESLRETLAHNRALAKAADADVCNPDSEVLPGRAAELQRQEEERWHDSMLELSRLQEGQDSFERTELFGRDPDVARVVRFLSDHNIPNVRAYAEYIAHTLPNAEQARNVALSNPGRYLGVAVPELKHVVASKALLEKEPLALGRPVVISIYDRAVEAMGEALYVAGPDDDSLWNKASAAKRAKQLLGIIEAATAASAEAKKATNDVVLAKAKLDEYVAQFGEGKLAQLRNKATDLTERRAAAEQRILEMRNSAKEAGTQARHARTEASRLQKQDLPKVLSRLQALTAYRDEWETRSAAWRQQQADAAGAKLAAETAEALANAALATARKTAEEAKRQGDDRETSATARELTAQSLATPDEKYDVDAALKDKARTLSEIASEYDIAAKALRAAESETTEKLAAERDVKAGQLKDKRGDYSERYPSDRFPMTDVTALAGSDYRELGLTAERRVNQAEKDQRETADAASSARTTLSLHQSKRKQPGHTVAGAETFSAEDLVGLLERRRRESASATQSALSAKEAAQAARNLARELKAQRDLYDGQRRALNGQSLDFSTALADVSRFTDASTVAAEVAALLQDYTSSKKAADSAEKRARNALELVTKIARDEAFVRTDAEIAAKLQDNSLENSAADADRIQSAIGNRIDALKYDLSKMDEDFAKATDVLMGLVGDSTKILRNAVERLKLPDNVPIVGGKSVFKMRTTVLSMTQEQKRPILAAYVEELTADCNIPETGAQLAAQALMRLADNRLGLRLLKMVEIEDEQYVPVEKLTHSGAEKLSMALFLYFITMRLRYEQRPAASREDSGVLLLDNPFAHASLRPIWVAIHSLAEAMKVQLIIATGMNELETLSVFKRHLRLSKTEMNSTTGRIHVKVTDYQFLPSPDQMAA